MKKFKMLALSFIVALSLGISVQVTNVQASESTAPLITQASDQIFVTRKVPRTTTQGIWVTESRNGKTYSGYIYNRGIDAETGYYSIFNGYIKTGPYAPLVKKLED